MHFRRTRESKQTNRLLVPMFRLEPCDPPPWKAWLASTFAELEDEGAAESAAASLVLPRLRSPRAVKLNTASTTYRLLSLPSEAL
jgi:hypothetical protein